MALVLYDQIEEWVRAEIVSHHPNLDDDLCMRGDLDTLITNIFEQDSNVGVYVDYMGGRRTIANEQFASRYAWVWSIMVMVLIRYDEDIEANLRTQIGHFATLFAGDHTVGGNVIRAGVMNLDQPEPGTINDVPFYWMPVIVNVWDRP